MNSNRLSSRRLADSSKAQETQRLEQSNTIFMARQNPLLFKQAETADSLHQIGSNKTLQLNAPTLADLEVNKRRPQTCNR
jgi:hypothetical protein